MGGYRRGESRSGTSELSLLVEQENGERTKLCCAQRNGARAQLVGPCRGRYEQLSTSCCPDQLRRRAASELEWTSAERHPHVLGTRQRLVLDHSRERLQREP